MVLNVLQRWEKQHWKRMLMYLKDKRIDLTEKNIPKIIHATSFQVIKKEHPEYCAYYTGEKSCHPEIRDLSCLLCACPNYDSSTEMGGCKIKSKRGHYTLHPNLPKGKVWDCSNCNINHSTDSVKRYLKRNIDKLKEMSENL